MTKGNIEVLDYNLDTKFMLKTHFLLGAHRKVMPIIHETARH